MSSRRGVAAVLAASTALIAALAVARGAAHRDPRWNVVVIVADDQTVESLPHDPPVMPFLQAAMGDPSGNWVRFANAFVTTPVCCPSRATMLTGRYAHHHGVLTNDDGARLDERSTIASALHAAGYHTGLVGKYLNGYPFGDERLVPAGWDRWAAKAQGSARSVYFDYTLVRGAAPVAYGHDERDYLTDVLAQEAVRFVRLAPPDRPFFLWFAPTAPHPPWIPAPRDRGADDGLDVASPASVGEANVVDKPAWIRALPALRPDERTSLQQDRRRSFETLLALDDAIETILRAIDDRGDLDRTVVVYVSDNGYSFGEHRWIGKRCPYDECLHVPLAIRYPGAPSRVEPALVSSVDLAPTFAQVAGVRLPGEVDGTSLVPLLRDDDAGWRNRAFAEYVGDAAVPGWSEIRTLRFAYVELGTGERELYDLRVDPLEDRSVADHPRYAAVVARLAPVLDRFRAT